VRSVEFHPEAQNELISAAQFYERETEGLGLDFVTTIQHAYERLLEFPASGPPFGRRLRRLLVPKFPVLDSELTEIWQHMLPGDVLVFYQHQTNRNATPWIQPKREQFEKALGLSPGVAKMATGTVIARDVAFFYCRKRGA
jgi:hypothetical protein